MQAYTPRAGRRALARTFVVLAAASVLGACADETTAPPLNAPARPTSAEAPAPELLATTVQLFAAPRADVYPSGAVRIDVAVSCSADATFDVIVEIEQQQKTGSTKTTVSGSETFPAVECTAAAGGWAAAIVPTTGAFKRGNATVRMRMDLYGPYVTPAELTQRVRLANAVE